MKAIPGSMALDPVSQKTSTTQFHQSEEILELEVIGAGVSTQDCVHMLASVMLVQNNANPRKYRQRRCA